MLILDHTQDLSGAERYRLTQLYPPPVFVKQASHEQLCGERDTLQSHLFGDELQRTYPCHTKSATWMSALFFGDKHSLLPASRVELIRSRIKQAAEYWGIAADVAALWNKIATNATSSEASLPDTDFAIVWQDASGVKERHYPLRNRTEVKQAAAWFGQYHANFDWADKHVIADKILSKAAELEADLESRELLDRCAGFGYSPTATVVDAWNKRASLTRQQRPEYAAQAEKLAEAISKSEMSVRDQGVRIRMANIMDQFDRQTGLHRLYDAGGLERPENCLFCITEKVATDFVNSHVQTVTGGVYEKSALEALDIEHVRNWFGDEFVNEVGGVLLDTTKLAAIVPTLPRPEAEMFERMAAAAGIPMFARMKTADAEFTAEQLASLAAQYQPVN